jgi:hypothetical protein
MKFTFDVSKCDRLFDVLVKGGVIRLAEGHVILTTELLAKRRYCKWLDSYSHITNECNYFCRQMQSVINDSRLTLGELGKMKLDVDPFLVNVTKFEGKRVLVQTGQVATTRGKNVVVSDELRWRMIKPRSPEVGRWKENTWQKASRRVKMACDMLIDKYIRQQQEQRDKQMRGFKRRRSPAGGSGYTRWLQRHRDSLGTPMMSHSTPWDMR